MTARVVSLLGLATMLALSAGGAARADWTPPDRLSAGEASGTPTLAFDARGWALATWAQRFGAGRRSASRAPAAAAFRPDRPAPGLGDEVVESPPPAPVVDRAGGVLAVQQRKLGHACGVATRYALTPRFGRVTGTFASAGRARVVFSHTEPPAVALAGNARGAAVLVWREVERDGHGRCLRPVRELVRAAVRRPRHGFGTPVTLARSVSTGPIAAAVGAQGDVLVVWRRGNMLETRTRSAHGAWGPKLRVLAGRAGSIAAAVEANGSADLVWSSWQGNIPDDPRTVNAATRPPHARRFAATSLGRDVWPANLVDRRERRAVRLALLPHAAIAAWTSWDGSNLRVLTATSTGGRFGTARPSTPAGSDYTLGDLATAPAGLVGLALGSEAVDSLTTPFAAFAERDGSFGAPEPIAPGAETIGGEALAFSPVTGRPTLVWTQTRFQDGQATTATLASTRR